MIKRSILLATASLLATPARAHALKGTVDSLDDIPEALHTEYVQQGDKFVLQVEGFKPQGEFERVQTALNNERRQHGDLKGRVKQFFGDDKFEDVRASLDRIPELEASQGTIDDDKLNTIVEGRLRTKLAPIERERDTYKGQVTELQGTVGELTGKEKRRLVRDEMRAAAKKAGVMDAAMDDALLLGDTILEVREDDGKVVVREGTGYPQGVEPSVLFTDLQSKRPHWFGESRGGGAAGSRGGTKITSNPWSKDGWNMTEQGRIYQADSSKAEQLAKAAGHDSALGARRPA